LPLCPIPLFKTMQDIGRSAHLKRHGVLAIR
jgi:hypothetical protein